LTDFDQKRLSLLLCVVLFHKWHYVEIQNRYQDLTGSSETCNHFEIDGSHGIYQEDQKRILTVY